MAVSGRASTVWLSQNGNAPLWEPLDDTDPTDMKVLSVGWMARDTPEYKLVVPHQQCSQVRRGEIHPLQCPVLNISKLDIPSPKVN